MINGRDCSSRFIFTSIKTFDTKNDSMKTMFVSNCERRTKQNSSYCQHRQEPRPQQIQQTENCGTLTGCSSLSPRETHRCQWGNSAQCSKLCITLKWPCQSTCTMWRRDVMVDRKPRITPWNFEVNLMRHQRKFSPLRQQSCLSLAGSSVGWTLHYFQKLNWR